MRKRLLLALLLTLLAVPAWADTLTLDDGTSYEGKVLSESGGKVRFKTSSGMTLTIERSRIASLVKGRTRIDEYKERLAAIAADDLRGLFELAEWCEAEKLHAQRKSVLDRIRRVCPDHPRLRRELGEVWRDGKWVKEPEGLPPLSVEAGEKTRVEAARAVLVLPRGWKVAVEGGRVSATGPDRYRIPPVLAAEFRTGAGDTGAAFPEKEGWEKPAPASAAGLEGHRSRRVVVEDRIERREEAVLLAGGDRVLDIRLTCLLGQEKVFLEALELALRSVAFDAPEAGYVNEHYGYCLDLPQPADKWSAAEDEEHDLVIMHERVEVTDYARLLVIGADGEQEIRSVREIFEAHRAEVLRYGGTEKQIDFCGEKAVLVDGAYLDDGIPCRLRLLMVTHGGRLYLITFDQHEHGQEKTNGAWDAVVGSFRFLKP